MCLPHSEYLSLPYVTQNPRLLCTNQYDPETRRQQKVKYGLLKGQIRFQIELCKWLSATTITPSPNFTHNIFGFVMYILSTSIHRNGLAQEHIIEKFHSPTFNETGMLHIPYTAQFKRFRIL